LAGIYIHIPFCKQACTYCNFHFSTVMKNRGEMIEAIEIEIRLQPPLELRSFPYQGTPKGEEIRLKPIKIDKEDYKFIKTKNPLLTEKEKIETLYFGGGTPSILNADELQIIFDALHERFEFDSDIEITLEANPDDINDEKLQLWKQFGINRLSVGLQSFNEEELKWMNRAHTAAESLQCLDKIKKAGFNNYSIDLIYGSPLLSNEEWKKNIAIILENKVPHISCYALTVEPKTALAHTISKNSALKIDEEKQAEQFAILINELTNAGYEHYEISNFAKPSFRSKHNSSYWQSKKYYGFGPSAHSYDGNKTRRWNIANNALYISSLQKNTLPYEEEILTPTQQLNEYIMTALRTIEGIDLDMVKEKFGKEVSTKLEVQSEKYMSTNKITLVNNKLILTNEGKFFADGIAADLFF
jgi:oxygen-independent coproporphyrinogen-3 oxidase